MFSTTLSSRAFNQDIGRAKKAASEGPVFITERGKPTHVLLTIADYQRLASGPRKFADALAMPEIVDINFDPPRINIGLRAAVFE